MTISGPAPWLSGRDRDGQEAVGWGKRRGALDATVSWANHRENSKNSRNDERDRLD